MYNTGMFKNLSNRLVSTTLLVSLFLIVPAYASAAVIKVDGKPYQNIGIAKSKLPKIGAKSALLIDPTTGRVLYGKDNNKKRAMASTTKIMTAVVVLQYNDPSKVITVPKAAVKVGESTSRLEAGKKVTVGYLLDAMLIKSGNDAATALAISTSGSVKAFVSAMNKKAKELGLVNTRFTNPHGLDEAGHYTTAYDLGKLSQHAMKDARFKKIVAKKHIVTGYGKYKKKEKNTNVLLFDYKGATGTKTGWTGKAGYCLSASSKREKQEFIAITLGCNTEKQRFTEAARLMNWGYKHLSTHKIASKGKVVGKARVSDFLDKSVEGALAKDVKGYYFDLGAKIVKTYDLPDAKAPIAVGDVIGTSSYHLNGKKLATCEIVSTQDIAEPTFSEKINIAFQKFLNAFNSWI